MKTTQPLVALALLPLLPPVVLMLLAVLVLQEALVLREALLLREALPLRAGPRAAKKKPLPRRGP